MHGRALGLGGCKTFRWMEGLLLGLYQGRDSVTATPPLMWGLAAVWCSRLGRSRGRAPGVVRPEAAGTGPWQTPGFTNQVPASSKGIRGQSYRRGLSCGQQEGAVTFLPERIRENLQEEEHLRMP